MDNQRNMSFISDFLKRIEKLEKANIISYSIEYCNNHDDLITMEEKRIKFPRNILCLYNQIQFLNITQPRQFEILSIDNMSIVENRYLHFSNINFSEKLYFDTFKRNEAEEWDIINLSDDFIVTKTIGSFLTNKVWAWIDRGREIWKEE